MDNTTSPSSSQVTQPTNTPPIQQSQIPTQPEPVPSSLSPTDPHMILVILLLVFVYPIGLVAMWILMKHWPTWLKLVITAPVILAILGVLAAGALIALNPMGNQ